MKRKNICKFMIAAIALLAVTLTGCSKKSSITVDTAKLASELLSETVTSDSLTATGSAMIPNIYFISQDVYAGGSAYMSSNATACEIAVIECKEEKQTADVEKLFKQRVESRSNDFASYNPGEVTKLGAALIKSAGKYCVLVVCDDTEKAGQILKNYGF